MDDEDTGGGVLALLDAYEDDLLAPDMQWLDELLSPASPPVPLSDTSSTGRSSSNDDDDSSTTCRFKRARQRKKQDLASYRSQVLALQETLQTLEERRTTQSKVALAAQSPRLAAAWEAAARRQEQERRDAEALNRELRRMVDATLRQTRRLQALLLHPAGLEVLVHHKRLRKHSGEESSLCDSVVLHNLLVSVNVIQAGIDELLRRFGIHGSGNQVQVETQRGDAGCGLVVEAMDSCALPHDIAASSMSMWRFIAYGDGPGVAGSFEEADSTTRVHVMDLVNGAFRASYTGRCLYRRRVVGDRVVIVWAESWTPSSDSTLPGCPTAVDFKHESFQREGFVCLSQLRSSPSQLTVVQCFYRAKRDACGDASCRKGCCGDVTMDAVETSVKECVQSEIKRFIQGMENIMFKENRLENALLVAAQAVAAQ